MKKKITYILLIILSLFIIVGCNRQENSKINNEENKSDINNNEVVNSVKIIINDKEYILNLEDNDTAKSLVSLLPLEITMNELNGNEKYIYLDKTFPTKPIKPNRINAGDVMLYGNNCLVLFYKSFDTSYSYTLIGHIDNLPDLGNSNISVIISQ